MTKADATSVPVPQPGPRSFVFADAIALIVALTAVAVWRALPDGVNHAKLLILIPGSLAVLPFAAVRLARLWQSHAIRWPQVSVILAAAALPVWGVVSMIATGAPWPESVIGAWGRNAGLLTLVAVASLLIGAATFSAREIRRLIPWLMALAAVEVVIGAMQWVGWNPVPGIDYGQATVMGTFGNANFAAGYFTILICLLLTRVLARGVSAFQRWMSAVLVVALAVLLVGTQAAQAAGAGLAGLAVAFVAFTIAYRGRFRRLGLAVSALVVAVGVLAVAASVAGRGPLARFWADSGFEIRVEYWKATIATFSHLPFFGTGPDGLKRYMGEFRPDSYVVLLGEENKLDAAHNIALQVAATLGTVGLGLWLVVFVGAVVLLTRRLILGPVSSPVLAAGISGALAAYLVQGMVSIDMLPLICLGWVLAGVSIAYSRSEVSGAQIVDAPQFVVGATPRVSNPRSRRAVAAESTDDAQSSRELAVTWLIAAVLALSSLGLLYTHMQVASKATGRVDPEYALRAMTDPLTPCPSRNGLAQAAMTTIPADELIGVMQEATTVDPRCGFLIHYQSELAINTGDLDLADESTLVGVELDPLLPASWVLRGLVQVAKGDVQGAQASLAEGERVAALSPAEGTGESQVAVLRDRLAQVGALPGAE